MKRQPLDYRTSTKPTRSKKQEWGPPPNDAESRRWRFYRGIYRSSLLLLFVLIAFYVGPNIILFRKLTYRSLNDFVPIVQSKDVPTVEAIRDYYRNTGQWPDHVEEVLPRRLRNEQKFFVSIDPVEHQISFDEQLGETVVYSFKPGTEGWSVSGYFVSGPLPIPAINLPPTTRP